MKSNHLFNDIRNRITQLNDIPEEKKKIVLKLSKLVSELERNENSSSTRSTVI